MNIEFVYPSFLYAMFAALIPVIIHLFNFKRYKVIYFSNVAFLRNLQEQTKAKSQIKHWLVLLTRILIIIALAVAFAQPFIPSANSGNSAGSGLVGIYVDNSFSMDSKSTFGRLLDVARNKAIEIAESYPSTTRFLLITNDLDPRHQHPLNREQLTEYITQIESSPTVLPVQEAVTRIKDIIGRETEEDKLSSAYIISDFQKVSTNIAGIKTDSLFTLHLLPLSTQPTNNIYIDTCWFETPVRKINQPERLYVRIVNASEESYENVPVQLYINDSVKSVSSLNLTPNSKKDLILSFTNTGTGLQNGKITISDYPVTYDNDFYFSFNIANQLKTLVINQDAENSNLNALFRNDPYVKLSNELYSNIDYTSLKQNNLVILNSLKDISSGLQQELESFLANGGVVVVLPGIDINTNSYNLLLSSLNSDPITSFDTINTRFSEVSYNHPLFDNTFQRIDENVSLPSIFGKYLFKRNTRSNDIVIFKDGAGAKVLSECSYKKGKLYVFAMNLSLESTDFARHPLFVPTFYNITLSSQLSEEIYQILDISNRFIISNPVLLSNEVVHIKSSDGLFDIIPSFSINGNKVWIDIAGRVSMAGNYLVTDEKGVPFDNISFNYNRKESDLSYYTRDELIAMTKDFSLSNTSVIENPDQLLSISLKLLNQGTPLWKYFIISALFLLAVEIALIRLIKKQKD